MKKISNKSKNPTFLLTRLIFFLKQTKPKQIRAKKSPYIHRSDPVKLHKKKLFRKSKKSAILTSRHNFFLSESKPIYKHSKSQKKPL